MAGWYPMIPTASRGLGWRGRGCRRRRPQKRTSAQARPAADRGGAGGGRGGGDDDAAGIGGAVDDVTMIDRRPTSPPGAHPADDAVHDDSAVTEDVCNAVLGAAPPGGGVDAADVEVSVADGVVVLTGVVSDATSRHHLEQVIFDVPGVRGIESRLEVRPRPKSTATSSDSLPVSRPLTGGAR
jgi:hypothetical protein